MSVLLHLSDTHFGTEQPAVVEALRHLARTQRPERAILSGDVTQRARRGQFAAARRFVDSLPMPTLAIPGNHDIPLFNLAGRLLRPYAGFRRAFGQALECEWSAPGWLVIGINTTRWWRHKHGEVSRAQVARVAERLRRADPDQLRIVATHQPLLAIRESDRRNLLRGHAEAATAWAQAGADLLLGGHIHLPYIRPLRTRYPTLEREAWVVQAGTAVSHRVRGAVPNSVNLLRREGTAACVVERWDFDRAVGEFVCVQRESLPIHR